MKYQRLGESGLMVSRIVLGTARFGELAKDAADRIVGAAMDAGISAFDTADAYNKGESETQLGAAIASRRDSVVLCSKVGLRVGDDDAAHGAAMSPTGLDHAARWQAGIAPTEQGLSRKHIVEGVEASLRRLRTDYIDLYQVHRWDPNVPIEETLGALDALVRAGKIRYVGCSGYAAYQLYRALWAADRGGFTAPISIQVPYSLANRLPERELLPACCEAGVGVLAFSVLAAGMLSGRYQPDSVPEPTSRLGSRQVFRQRYWTDATFALVSDLSRRADAAGRTIAELATAAVLANPAVSAVVYGVSSVDQITDACVAADRPLESDELGELLSG